MPSSLDAGPFLVSVDHAGGSISVHGELDRRNAAILQGAISALIGTAQSSWTVDAAAITFCDATGLRALIAGNALARSHGRELRLVRPSPFLQAVVIMGGAGSLICSPASRASAGAPLDTIESAEESAITPPRQSDDDADIRVALQRSQLSAPVMAWRTATKPTDESNTESPRSPGTERLVVTPEARAYGGSAHGQQWPVRGHEPPAWVELPVGASSCFYRVARQPRTGRPARDHLGNYLYVPIVETGGTENRSHPAKVVDFLPGGRRITSAPDRAGIGPDADPGASTHHRDDPRSGSGPLGRSASVPRPRG